MIKYENQCVDCGLPCMGNDCKYRHVPVYICDCCGDEAVDLYMYDDEELCIDCIISRLEKVSPEN